MATAFEGTALSRLLRLVVPQAFAKLDDRAVRGWATNIQHDIQVVRCPRFAHMHAYLARTNGRVWQAVVLGLMQTNIHGSRSIEGTVMRA